VRCLSRRLFLEETLLAATAATAGGAGLGGDPLRDSEPGAAGLHLTVDVPVPIAAVLRDLLRREPAALNTDWDGTMPVEALLLWSRLGLAEGRTLAERWFEYHLEHDHRLSDAEFCRTYQGPVSRVVRSGVLPFSLYSGLYGLAFPCHELYRLTGDARARQVCLDVADAILHLAPREGHGLILHDDHVLERDQGWFTIPDAIYFAVRALMIASTLDAQAGPVYRKQALHQIRACAGVFLDRQRGLARTMLTARGPGRSYWCRASGWLMYALAAVCRYLPREHEEFSGVAADLKTLTDGVAAAAGPTGGLRALANDPKAPEETTGTAMCLAAIDEAVAQGWIPDVYEGFCRNAWGFLLRHVAEDGTISGVYTGWAMTAEEGTISMDQGRRDRGWIPATILFAAYRWLQRPR
jgi:hypothetical protein